MIFKSVNRRAVWFCVGLVPALLLVGTAFADPKPSQPATEPAPADSPPDASSGKPVTGDFRTRMMEDVLRMREFFDTTVPGTMKKFKLVFSFSPRSSDVRKGEYIRMATTLRYGLSGRWEIYGGTTPFVPNPINDGVEHRWGMGEAKLGVRYNWGHWGKLFDNVTVGLEGRTPLGKPPPTLIDSFGHLVPFINTSRPLLFDNTTLYINLVYDRAFDAPLRENPPPGVLRRHVFIASPSVLYKPGEFGASVSYSWRVFDDEHIGRHFGHEIKAGPIWDLPLWRTQSWGLPGKWQVELAGRVTFEEGLPVDKGISARVRWRTSIREVFSKKSYERKPHS
jgi:hypothetical protein